MAKRKKAKKKTVKKTKAPFKLRSNVRMKALDPAYLPKVRKEHLEDTDYIKNLPIEIQRWYAQFMDEYVSGSVRKDANGKVRKGYLHNTKELAKDCYDRNNRRNNDVLGVTKANGLLSDIDALTNEKDGWYISNKELTEDSWIRNIERAEEEDQFLSFEEYMKLKNNLTAEIREMYDKYYASRLKKA